MLMNVQVAHRTTATRTQIVITLMAHSNALVKVGTVATVAATATVWISTSISCVFGMNKGKRSKCSLFWIKCPLFLKKTNINRDNGHAWYLYDDSIHNLPPCNVALALWHSFDPMQTRGEGEICLNGPFKFTTLLICKLRQIKPSDFS